MYVNHKSLMIALTQLGRGSTKFMDRSFCYCIVLYSVHLVLISAENVKALLFSYLRFYVHLTSTLTLVTVALAPGGCQRLT